jgi:hypothetical protein
MQFVLDWIQKNPALFGILWSAFTAGVSLVARYIGHIPVISAIAQAFVSVGIDLPKLLAALKALLTGQPAAPPPSPPAPPSAELPPDAPTPPETPAAKKTLLPPSLKRVFGVGTIVLACAGCGLFRAAEPVITDVNMIANDAQEALQLVNIAAEAYFNAHPDLANVKAKYDQIYARVHVALDFAIRALTGVQDIDQAKLDSAFADFKTAYSDLADFLKSFGITVPTGKYLATPGANPVAPVPLAFTARGHR